MLTSPNYFLFILNISGNDFQKHSFHRLPRNQDKADKPVITNSSFLPFLKIRVVFADLEIINGNQVRQSTSLFLLGLGKIMVYLE